MNPPPPEDTPTPAETPQAKRPTFRAAPVRDFAARHPWLGWVLAALGLATLAEGAKEALDDEEAKPKKAE